MKSEKNEIKPKHAGGRPPKEIDAKFVYECALDLCTNREIAMMVDCDETTLHDRFSLLLEKARSITRRTIRKKQLECALKGNATLLIWLGKVELGQKEVQDVATLEAEVRVLLRKMEEVGGKIRTPTDASKAIKGL